MNQQKETTLTATTSRSSGERMERGTYLGGQQMAAVVGMHPYMSIGDVYAHAAMGRQRDDGIDDDEDPSRPSVLRRGRICEEGIISYLEEFVLKVPVGTLVRDLFVVDDDVPFFAGTIDAAEVDDTGAIRHIHEITVTSTRAVHSWGEDGDPDGVAKYKKIQDLHYQGITGADGGTVWLFVSDTGEIRRYPVKRNDDAINSLRDSGEAFWLQHVVTKTPPVFSGASDGAWAVADDSLNAIYLEGEAGALDPSPEMVAAAIAYDAARLAYQQAEDDKKGCAARIKAILGDHQQTRWEGGSVSWKRNKGSAKTDYVKVAKDLAVELAAHRGLEVRDVIASFEEPHTTVKQGGRVLRVTVKPPKEDTDVQES